MSEEHKMWMDESHGRDSSLYTAFCSCGKWVSSSLNERGTPEAEFRRHVEGRPMAWQERATTSRDRPMSRRTGELERNEREE